MTGQRMDHSEAREYFAASLEYAVNPLVGTAEYLYGHDDEDGEH